MPLEVESGQIDYQSGIRDVGRGVCGWINEYPRKENWSASETTLELASKELAERAGAEANFLITDAATSREPRV